ncbi:MAG: FAD synthetase [Alistipes sp.]|nr:FAD synthetase [Alistipes sp.]
MRVIYGFDSIPAISHAVATVGSYDGVHSGHRVLIEQVIARAKARGGDSVVVTFEPHPRITLGKAEGLKLLTTLEEKELLLERLGVDFMVVIPFDLAFSRLSHQQFIEQYLIGKLGIEELVVGYNHHFGHNKSGDYNYLTSQQPTLAVYQVEQQLVESSKVSSTVIRTTIESGDIRSALNLLGHTYIIIGQSDDMGEFTTDEYKLLPASGRYNALVNGANSTITICGSRICTNIKNQKLVIEI